MRTIGKAKDGDKGVDSKIFIFYYMSLKSFGLGLIAPPIFRLRNMKF